MIATVATAAEPAGPIMALGGGTPQFFPAAFWLVIIFVVAFLIIARYNPLRLLVLPFRQAGRLGRFLRGARGAQKGATRTAQRALGQGTDNISFFGPISRAFSSETLTDTMLRDITMRDKEVLERSSTLMYEWLHPLPETVPDAASVSPEQEQEEVEKSPYLFHFDLPMGEMLHERQSYDQYFYEDIDSQLIIRIFRGADRLNPDGYNDPADPEKGKRTGPDDIFYYIASVMRKTINGNVRKLAAWQTLILTIVFLLNVFFSYLHDLFGASTPGMLGSLPWGGNISTGDVFTVFLFIAAFAAILVLNVTYNFSQRNNARELDTYVRSYLAYLNSRFKSAEANVTRSIGQSIEEKGQDAAINGMIKLHWLAWRAFFIEKYLRGVFYQIKRNTVNYMLFIPLAFLFVTYFAYDGVQRSTAGGQSFELAWDNYKDCVRMNRASGTLTRDRSLQCARPLAQARAKSLREYLSSYSTCYRWDQDGGQCGTAIDEEVARLIVEAPETRRAWYGLKTAYAINLGDNGNTTDSQRVARDKVTRFGIVAAAESDYRSQPWLFFLLFGVQIAWYVYNLARAPRTVRKSIDESTWIEFHKMKLQETTTSVIQRFIQEIINMRKFFGGFGGGS